MPGEDKYMTVEEVAQYLGFEKQTIYNKVHAKEIPFHKIGPKAVRFKKGEIDAWIQSQKNRERRFVKRGDKYYLMVNSPFMASQMVTEDEFLADIQKEVVATWRYKSMELDVHYANRLDFGKKDLQNARDILKAKLVYPRLLKNNTPVFEWVDTAIVEAYLTIIKIFEGKLPFSILKRLKERLLENAQELLYMADAESSEAFNEAEIGFMRETVASDLVRELSSILLYLAYGKKDIKNRYLVYANTYFDKESLLALYFHGFCDLVISNTYSGNPPEYFLKDRDISELSIEQIKQGLKERILTPEAITDRTTKLEADLKALKSIVKQSLKGDGRGRKN